MNTRALLSAGLLGLAACTSPYYDHRFQPAPLEAEVSTQAVPEAQLRALITVLAIERGKDKVPDRAIVRFRLENLGSVPAKLDVPTLSLVSADLMAFDPPAELSGECGDIEPGKDAVCDFAFPLPRGLHPDQLDLSGLNLRFTVLFKEHRVTHGATFRRVDWLYYDPYYPRVSVGVGVGWCD